MYLRGNACKHLAMDIIRHQAIPYRDGSLTKPDSTVLSSLPQPAPVYLKASPKNARLSVSSSSEAHLSLFKSSRKSPDIFNLFDLGTCAGSGGLLQIYDGTLTWRQMENLFSAAPPRGK